MTFRTTTAGIMLAAGIWFTTFSAALAQNPEWMAKVPPARAMPPLGDFPRWPSEPGYYSLKDLLTDTWREKPPQYPYRAYGLSPPCMFDVDFRYLDDPNNTQIDFFDPIHRMRLGENWLFATGGQVWWRHQQELNSRLTGKDNTFDLLRETVYGDLWYRDQFRLFAQFYDAHTFNQDLPPGPLDADHADIQNLFVDLKVGEIEDKNVYVRVGRQEMLYGSQRLISTLDWANVRRTFQGVKAFRNGEKWDVDLFWVQPINVLAAQSNSADPTHMNWADDNQNLVGLWTTYRPRKNNYLDAYYLMLDNANHNTMLGIKRMPFNMHTIGSRYYGDYKQFLWDVEPMLQFGDHAGQTLFAGSSSTGVGYYFKETPMTPTVWLYYDWASGDQNPGSGTYTTFNQMFPFGHYYQGWSDVIGRQNMHDIGAYLGFWPTKWMVLRLQYHHLELAAAKDALYNIGGLPYRRDPTGAAGRNVGDDVSFIGNFHVDAHNDILAGYGHLFPGRFLRSTGPGGQVGMFYLIYNFHF